MSDLVYSNLGSWDLQKIGQARVDVSHMKKGNSGEVVQLGVRILDIYEAEMWVLGHDLSCIPLQLSTGVKMAEYMGFLWPIYDGSRTEPPRGPEWYEYADYEMKIPPKGEISRYIPDDLPDDWEDYYVPVPNKLDDWREAVRRKQTTLGYREWEAQQSVAPV